MCFAQMLGADGVAFSLFQELGIERGTSWGGSSRSVCGVRPRLVGTHSACDYTERIFFGHNGPSLFGKGRCSKSDNGRLLPSAFLHRISQKLRFGYYSAACRGFDLLLNPFRFDACNAATPYPPRLR